jgi:hypothetical protein
VGEVVPLKPGGKSPDDALSPSFSVPEKKLTWVDRYAFVALSIWMVVKAIAFAVFVIWASYEVTLLVVTSGLKVFYAAP